MIASSSFFSLNDALPSSFSSGLRNQFIVWILEERPSISCPHLVNEKLLPFKEAFKVHGAAS